jgi:O-succinylbenzoic acid--CoA ligase
MSGRHPPARGVVDVLARSPGAPEGLALVGPERAWTYAELDRAVDERARMLRARGIAGGTDVGAAPVLAGPDPDGVIALLAHWRAGVAPAPLDARLAEPEREAALRPADAQVVLWTSGSAGRPRGVALSFDNLRASVAAAAARLELSGRDVWLASLAPTHVGGLMLVVRSILLGGCLVAAGRFDARSVSDLVDGNRSVGDGPPASDGPPGAGHPAITHVALVPTQLHRLLAQRAGAPPPATLRCALVGGAHAADRLVAEALAAGWPLALTYGMTEMSSQVATAPPALVRRKPGTVGPPLEGIELRVAEEGVAGAPKRGELLVRGPTRALGYVTPRARVDRASTPGEDRAAAALEGPGGLADADGWYHTGDYGWMDEDGDLWVTGRRIDRIVTGGVTVDAVEVEEALRAHPSVLDACVVGVPDPEWGERVGAWVVPLGGEPLDVEELDRHAGVRLGPAKRPRLWRVDDALPLNANGKADRAAVRRALERR